MLVLARSSSQRDLIDFGPNGRLSPLARLVERLVSNSRKGALSDERRSVKSRFPRELSLGVIACLLLATYSEPAYAQCTVPNTITNGQVADASEVMENFDAVAACTDDAVAKTGTPQTGAIAVFTGEQSVTSGDLSGDVTTAGGTTTTLTATGVTAGNYTLADITVDAKGRVTAIASGSLPGTETDNWTQLTLNNPNAETGNTNSWTQQGGGFNAGGSGYAGHTMTPFQGSYAFVASSNADPKMYQQIDVSSYATQIDAGELLAKMEAYACDTYDPGELPYIYLEFLNASNGTISRIVSAQPAQDIGSGIWRYLSVEGRVPAQTRKIRVYLWASRANGTANNVAYDLVKAFIKGA